MNEIEKAIENLKYIQQTETPYGRLWNMCELAISALKKQIPKKPIEYDKTNRADCPVCGATVRGIGKPYGSYCSGCGQSIDWSVEE